MNTNNLVWLRNDLRLDDNPAIFRAQQQGNIKIVFILSVKQWQKHHESEAKIGLKLDRVKQLAQHCSQLGIAFDLLECDWFAQIPELLSQYCQNSQITQVWFNQETPVDENIRDTKVSDCLQSCGIAVQALAYDLLVSQPVFNLSGTPFKVFTAYYKKWLTMLCHQNNQVLAVPKPQGDHRENGINMIHKHSFAYRTDLWPADSELIQQRLKKFMENKLFAYAQLRDYPDTPGTSLLSPYLALGCIGPRHCLWQIKHSYENSSTHNPDAWLHDDWLRELAWRDFYRQLMWHFPHISKNRDFKHTTSQIPWRTDTHGFNQWCQGQTGFPIIDAAMRQLNQTGWMHNRLRMLTASFLTKLLFIDWRLGEKYFMQQLIDGEFCANNGGWQWSASTGCDSAPYFRVFNPTAQSEKFDQKADFIRRFVPEIAQLDDKSIHNPTALQRQQCNYAAPVVEYKSARERAIEWFKAAS